MFEHYNFRISFREIQHTDTYTYIHTCVRAHIHTSVIRYYQLNIENQLHSLVDYDLSTYKMLNINVKVKCKKNLQLMRFKLLNVNYLKHRIIFLL